MPKETLRRVHNEKFKVFRHFSFLLRQSVTELLQTYRFTVEGGGIAQFFSIGSERPSAPVS
jgi:hypothetical protein